MRSKIIGTKNREEKEMKSPMSHNSIRIFTLTPIENVLIYDTARIIMNFNGICFSRVYSLSVLSLKPEGINPRLLAIESKLIIVLFKALIEYQSRLDRQTTPMTNHVSTIYSLPSDPWGFLR